MNYSKIPAILTLLVTFALAMEPARARASWIVSADTVLPEGRPVNDYVRKVVTELARRDGVGVPVTLDEFRAWCDRASREVYRDPLLKYASPRSVAIQKREHRDYTKVFMKEKRLLAGVEFLRRHDSLLRDAERRYGVARRDIVSILMWESGLGEFVGEFRIFNIFIGHLLYLDAAREDAIAQLQAQGNFDPSKLQSEAKQMQRLNKLKRRAVRNLVSLVRISKAEGLDPTRQVGSWGGAIGFPQFMPASMKFAVDGDRDGEVDLNHWPDAISSVANYLARHGYKTSTEGRKRGIHAYNPIDSYVKGVMLYADTVWKRYRNGQ